MALQQIGLAFFSGLETEKPAAFTAANTGATFYATDTKKLWIYDDDTSGWAIALEPLHIVAVGVDKGVADLTTVPMASPTDGAYYTTSEPGDYIKFAPPTGGLIGVAKGDVLIWDGAAWTIQANSNLIHHSNGMVSTPQASIAAISGGGDKVLVTKEYVLSSAIGAMEYKGAWDASTGFPTLPPPSSDPTTGNKGWFYIVSVGGTQTPPGGTSTVYAAGDWVMSDGANWDKIDNTSSVASVFGRTGVIVSQAGDYALAQITGLQTALDLKAPLASPTFTGTVSGIDKAMVGLTDVDDTSDADKPVSTDQQTEIDTKEDDLGAPTTDGQILASTIAKARTWIDAPALVHVEKDRPAFDSLVGWNSYGREPKVLTPFDASDLIHFTVGDAVVLLGGASGEMPTTIVSISGINITIADIYPVDDATTLRKGETWAGYKLIDNPTTTSGNRSVNLMAIGDTTQEGITYVDGVKYKSYTTTEISALPDSELGTFLFDSTLNSLVQCTDATAKANVWEAVGGSSGGTAEKGGIAHSITTDYAVGDIVTEASKVYRCITAHTKKTFDAADWFALDEEVTVQPVPTAPAELTGTPTLGEINAILTYSKEISTALVAAGVFK